MQMMMMMMIKAALAVALLACASLAQARVEPFDPIKVRANVSPTVALMDHFDRNKDRYGDFFSSRQEFARAACYHFMAYTSQDCNTPIAMDRMIEVPVLPDKMPKTLAKVTRDLQAKAGQVRTLTQQVADAATEKAEALAALRKELEGNHALAMQRAAAEREQALAQQRQRLETQINDLRVKVAAAEANANCNGGKPSQCVTCCTAQASTPPPATSNNCETSPPARAPSNSGNGNYNPNGNGSATDQLLRQDNRSQLPFCDEVQNPCPCNGQQTAQVGAPSSTHCCNGST